MINHSHKLLWIFLGIAILLIGAVSIYSFYLREISTPIVDLNKPLSLKTVLANPKIYDGKYITIDAYYYEATEKVVLATQVVTDGTGWRSVLDENVWVNWGTEPPEDKFAQLNKLPGVGGEYDLYGRVLVEGIFNIDKGVGHMGEYDYSFKIMKFDLLPPNADATATTTDPIANWKTYRNEKYGFEFRYPAGFNEEFLVYVSLRGTIGIPKNAPAGFIETVPDIDSTAGSYMVSKNPVEIKSTKIQGQEARIVTIKTTNEAFCTGCMNGEYSSIVVTLPKPLTFNGETNTFVIIGNENIPSELVPGIISTFKFAK